MSLHPFERFLGVPENATAHMLLGLRIDGYDKQMVDERLRIRLAEIFRHPDGRSDDAEMVRSVLREAAATIKRGLTQQLLADHKKELALQPEWMAKAVRSRSRPRTSGVAPLNLTAFDRLVLSVLVACGGWNARSRAQLVGLAQTYGVSVQGLLRVMQGLSEYARSGGPRIGVSEIVSRETTMPIAPLAVHAPPPIGQALLDRLAEDFGNELKRGGAWPTIRLAIIFGVLTLVMGIIALRTVFRSTPSNDQKTELAASGDEGGASQPGPSRVAATAPTSHAIGIARYPKQPTFLGNGLPAEAVNAVDHLPALPGQLDELARKITVADGEPSEAVYKQWAADIDSIALAWVIGDASTRMAIDQAISETLRAAADTPAVSDALLKSLIPPASIVKPLDLWRGAWMAATLARIASSPNLPPVVVDRARNHLEIALSKNLRGSMTPEAASDAWLAQCVPQLVQMLPFDEKAYDSWELWLAAERAIGESDRHDAAIVFALRSILETDYDLSLPGPAVNVAARLLNNVLHANSAIGRQRLIDLFDDEAIVGRDLWVLTSLMASADDDAQWFPDRLIVPEDADMAHRWRVRDDLAKAWPAPSLTATEAVASAATPKLDPIESERWLGLANRVLSEAAGTDQTTLMQQIVDASRLNNAAAALMVNIPSEASRIMRQIEDGWIMGITPGGAGAPKGPAPAGAAPQGVAPRPGQPIGADGVWAAKYAELGKNTEARGESLRSLRSNAGTDLGPVDAALLVHEAYRGSPQEVRDIAQAVVQSQFKSGPQVAMQLLDQLPDAPAAEPISEMIQVVTDRILPGVRSTAWPSEARLALVHHALDLRDPGGAPIDEMMEPLIESYSSRATLARKDSSANSTPLSPQEAAEALLRALSPQAEFAAPAEPAPADLPSLQRRHNTRVALSDGPIQMFVAYQLAILDLTTYLTVAEQPMLRARAMEIMREHAATRMRMRDALEQALDVERAVLDVWRLRLGLDPKLYVPEPAQRPEEGTP